MPLLFLTVIFVSSHELAEVFEFPPLDGIPYYHSSFIRFSTASFINLSTHEIFNMANPIESKWDSNHFNLQSQVCQNPNNFNNVIWIIKFRALTLHKVYRPNIFPNIICCLLLNVFNFGPNRNNNSRQPINFRMTYYHITILNRA